MATEQSVATTAQSSSVEQRYGSLRTLIAIFCAVAVLAIGAPILIAVRASATLEPLPDGALPMLFAYGIGSALVLFALAGALHVLLDMEEHQRAIRQKVETYLAGK